MLNDNVIGFFVKGAGDFFSLTVQNGYLDFRFDLGSGTAHLTTTR